MSGRSRVRFGIRIGLATCFLGSLALIGTLSCGAPTAVLVNGPGGAGNTPPTMTIIEPSTNIVVGQGTPFLIRWNDSDPDDNAQIAFDLVNVTTNAVVPLVAGLAENDQVGPDSHTAGTTLIPIGAYHLRGAIDDAVNPPETVFAVTTGANPQRVVVRVLEEGAGEQGVPPSFVVTEPQFDQSVTQEDVINVVVSPQPAGTPFDPDSDATLYIVFDTDLDPNNDDPVNPNPAQIIVMSTTSIAAGTTDAVTIPITIDLTDVPPRAEGAPYFIRATADDGTNPRVHQYAIGTLHVTQLAAGVVDLFDIGRQLSGTRWYGFNPAANAGSTVRGIGDFDADGVQDFIIVARFGNPRNVGQVGEAYLIYGLDGVRFGGAISVNSVTETVPGVLFEAPPIRLFPSGQFPIPGVPRSDGITDVAALPDFTADGRPEIIFGMPHVHGAFDSMDYDPGDTPPTEVSENEEIEVVLRQNLVTVQVGDDDPDEVSSIYTVDDTYISAPEPGTSFGSSTALAWQNDGGANRRWTLIKFADVLDQIPDIPFLIDITTVEATLELRVFDLGGQGSVHLSFSDFDEFTTYDGYAANGGDPQPDIDFFVEPEGANGALDQVDGSAAGTVEVDVSVAVQRLLDGVLDDGIFNNELRFIIVPDDDAPDQTQVRSSEFGNEPDRPTLRISYERFNIQGALGCYLDLLVNNLSDTNTADPFDVQNHAGGMAAIVNSTNRDNDGQVNPDRLENTVVTLEFAGQRPGFVLSAEGVDQAGGDIFVRADNTAAENPGNDEVEPGRLAGARIVAGLYDTEDHLQFRQPARDDSFGQSVGTMGDVDNDGFGEIVISAPRNERYLEDLTNTFGFASTHWNTTVYRGSVVVIPGQNYNALFWRENGDDNGTSTVPSIDHFHLAPFGSCVPPLSARHTWEPAGSFEVFAEDIDDMLGGAGSAGDFNQDGLDDLVCGAFLNDRPGGLADTGAVYVLYSRNLLADFNLAVADDPLQRPPMLRVRGATRGDQLGWRQTSGRDVNGDRIEDVFLSSPRSDYGGITRSTCGSDFDDDGNFDQDDLNLSSFNLCQQQFGNDLYRGDACKAFDYDNDNDIDNDDRCVFCCLSDDCAPEATCTHGRTPTACCEALVDNGIAAVLFGGRFVDGDRNLNQVATTDLPGVVFYGGRAGDRAGVDISSAGDFNQDGFGDILIAVPGETRRDSAGRLRVGVVYLVFGGTHLNNTTWNLSDPERGVGSVELPGIVFFSPYVEGRPNEAAPEAVGVLGDINNDGFDDIAIGNPRADFIDLSLPQGPDAPGTDAEAGRRRNTGDVYIIYGSNFGSNRGAP